MLKWTSLMHLSTLSRQLTNSPLTVIWWFWWEWSSQKDSCPHKWSWETKQPTLQMTMHQIWLGIAKGWSITESKLSWHLFNWLFNPVASSNTCRKWCSQAFNWITNKGPTFINYTVSSWNIGCLAIMILCRNLHIVTALLHS